LALMVVFGAAAAVVAAIAGPWQYAPVIGWDLAALVFVGSLWWHIGGMDAARTRTHATRNDPSRSATDLIVMLASIVSLGAVALVLVQAGSADGAEADALVGLAAGSVALSWVTVHTLFTLRYARLYYGETPGGIDFNQDAPPRYVDFAYVAFSLGMTFQVSDTSLENTTIRATALRHALLSYLFGAVILATAISLVAGLASGS